MKFNSHSWIPAVFLSVILSPIVYAVPVISELMASNSSTLADEDGEFSDWLEITNTGAAAMDLDGYYLTDDPGNLTKWQIPEASLSPGGFLVIFASDKDRVVGELHTNFKLSAGGEYLALIGPDGTSVLDSFDPEFPSVGQDVSFGINNSGDPVFFNLPTPNAANGAGSSAFIEPPVFSEPSRLFTGTLTLTISNSGAAGSVRYTLDGTEPTASSAIFPASLSITEPLTVKALAAVPATGESRIVTGYYAPVAADLQAFDSDLPITVVDADSQLVNKANNDEPKHHVRIFIIPVDAQTGRASITSPAQVITRAGANVRGNTSASKEKKNYNVEFWKEIEEDLARLDNGDPLPQDRTKKVLGMPADGDWVLYGLDLSHERCYFNNAFVYGLARDLGYPAPRTRYCELFINPGNTAIADADYRGIYMWVEKIETGNDRIDLQPFNSGETDPAQLGGYIVRANDVGAGDLSFRTRQPYNTPTYDGHQFSIFAPQTFDANHPGNNTLQNVTPADRDRIDTYFSDFEDALFSPGFNDPANGYAKFIDPRTFMMYQSLQELATNNDTYTASIYFEKDVGDRLKLSSLWDFDWAFTRGHYVSPGGGNAFIGWWYDTPNFVNFRDDCIVPWFLRLAEDPEYLNDWHDLWAEMRRGLLSDNGIDSRLDGLSAQLQEATVRDRAKFGGINISTQVSEMKSWIKGRAAWMDSELGGQVPTFSLAPGVVPASSQVTIAPGSGQPGAIYYTLDGTDPRLAETPVTPGTPVTLIPKESVWEYLDDGSNAGTAWRTLSGGWSSGPAELGFGDSIPENTGINSGPFGARHITTYFRHAVEIPNGSSFSGLTVFLRRDDGAVVYVNGTEVARSNLPATPAVIDYLTLASSGILGSAESTFYEFTADPATLVDGTNIIAVEVHQDSANSNDLSFDLELIGISGGSGGGGGPSPSAQTAPNPVPLSGVVNITARSYDGTNWSPLTQVTYIEGGELAAAGNLEISEIYYNPRAAEPAYGDEDAGAGGFEFVELMNTGTKPVDLAGVYLSNGIDVSFPADTVLPLDAGARAVLVDDRSVFQSRFGTAPVILGNYSGALSNGGEALELYAANGDMIETFTYADETPWPARPDGAGSSLERVTPGADPTDPANWRASVEVDGTPGTAGAGIDGRVVVNEVFPNSTPPLIDKIEFFNTTFAEIDVSGWFVSDSSSLRKYSFPGSTIISANGFLVIDESDFNPGGGTNPNDFALDSVSGDEIWLVEADASGKLRNFVDTIAFGPVSTEQSLGRVQDGTGELQLLTNTSFNLSNSSSYEGWAASAFSSAYATDQTLPDADADGDGLTNFLEFLFALDPTISQPSPLEVEMTEAGFEISYPRRVPLSGVDLVIALSEDMITWDSSQNHITQDVEIVPLGSQSEKVTDLAPDITDPNQYLRIEAIPNP